MGKLPSTRLNGGAWRKVSYKAQSPRSRHSSCAPTTLLQAAIWESRSHSRLRQIQTWSDSPRAQGPNSAMPPSMVFISENCCKQPPYPNREDCCLRAVGPGLCVVSRPGGRLKSRGCREDSWLPPQLVQSDAGLALTDRTLIGSGVDTA